MSKHFYAIVMGVILITGCVTTTPKTPQTQLQIRAYQTHLYESDDPLTVLKTVLNVLQDDGFIIRNAVVDLGLITAAKELDIENKGQAFFASLFRGSKARWKKNSIIEVSTNVSPYGRRMKVRSNFQVKVYDNKGGVVTVEHVDDAVYYRDFFMKIDKGLYLQRENL